MKHHIIITGTGRAGTSFLMQLLTELKLDTGFAHAAESIKPHSNAGMEIFIDSENSPYLIKDPELSVTLEKHLQAGNITIDHAFIPMRNLKDAAISRIKISVKNKNKLWRRLKGKPKYRRTEDGLIGTDKPEEQEAVLANVFYQLVFTLLRYEIPHTYIEFPRMTQDWQYLYNKLRPILNNKITEDDFKVAHNRISDTSLVHSQKIK